MHKNVVVNLLVHYICTEISSHVPPNQLTSCIAYIASAQVTCQMKDQYIKANSYGSSSKNIFSRILDLLTVRVPDTDYGPGAKYIADLVGACNGGALAVIIVCENHDIPVLDFREPSYRNKTIRDLVKLIRETPARCAIILDTRDNELMQKVCTRIANEHCDLRFKRVVFCLTDREPSSGTCLHIPGSTEDKMTMLLYHVPDHIQKQTESLECFRPLAEAMVDYTLFEPRVWMDVSVHGTLVDFLSSAQYQIARRVHSDPKGTDGYPSFEQEWRRSLATRLKATLPTPPVALCPSIHRVIPIGVSASDAMHAMEIAIPKDIKDPYVITVKTSAVDDQCGSIAITQPMQYTVVNVSCMINPGILVDFCRELQMGQKALAQEIHRLSQQVSMMGDKMAQMATRLPKPDNNDKTLAQPELECSKSGCTRVVTKRFRDGRRGRQCSDCVSSVARARIAQKKEEQEELEQLTKMEMSTQ